MCRISYIHYFCILNLAFDDDTQTRMKMWELILRERQAIWMLKEKRKSIRAIAKTKSMKKSSVWKPPATTWSAEQTTVVDDRKILKAVKMNPKTHVCKITNNFQKAGVIFWQSTVLRKLWHRITDATARYKPLTSTKNRKTRLEFAKKSTKVSQKSFGTVFMDR